MTVLDNLNYRADLMSGDTVVAHIRSRAVIPVEPSLIPLCFQHGGDIEKWLEHRAIDAHRAHARLLKKALRLRERDDLNSGEDETLDVRPYNLDALRSVIPEFVQISKKGPRHLTLEILMNKVFAISYDKSDRVYGNVLAALQQTDALWVKVTPYVDRPDVQLDVGVEKNSVSFPRILEGYGIKELNGQYIPSDVPDWELTKVNGYRPEDDVYEITSPTTCMVNAKFLNGMTGQYPLIYMMKRYPGKCLNASFSIKGDSLNSMPVNILLSSKGGNV